jgi:uncharacterized membrane protein (DUF373 family)
MRPVELTAMRRMRDMDDSEDVERSLRIRGLGVVEVLEDLLYATIAVFLLVGGVALLIGAGYTALQQFNLQNVTATVVTVLDQVLLVFMVAELLRTVRITLRDRSLAAEPFLVIGLIAGVRRILILTAKNEAIQPGPTFEVFWVEMLLLITLVMAMVIALTIWRRAYPGGEPRD